MREWILDITYAERTEGNNTVIIAYACDVTVDTDDYSIIEEHDRYEVQLDADGHMILDGDDIPVPA